ncbi:MAG: T9SS type A sorting domain-containing protein, partial [Bacteroidetes bacterium]|nr:T9SS type A sorting domain-containing protein [Bacteroidota bacterium]
AVNKGGGIYNDAGGILEIKNTIIAKNKCENGPDVFGNLTSLGHNLLGNDQETVFNSSTGDLVNTDPQLAYLANYGGPTFTHRVLEGSPVIDAGDANISFEIDQRGESRMYNGKVDIGAYEYDPTTRIFTQNDPLSFSLYPNPNHGEFTIQFANSVHVRAYQIFSITGQLIKKENLESAPGSEWVVNLGNIPAGIYVFMVESGNDVIRKKFIIE